MNELVKVENNQVVVAEEVIEQIKEFEKQKAKMDIMEKELKAELKNAMELVGMKKFIVNGLCASIKEPYSKTTVDSKKLKSEYPEVYEDCAKVSEVSSSITLSFEE